MTKRRAPLSIDAALSEIAGQLGGIGPMAEATGHSPSLVRAWGDPDRREQVSLRDACTLDTAYRAAGGAGLPLRAWYDARLEAAGVLAPAPAPALIAHAAHVIRECGEANAALLEAAAPNASARQLIAARREVEEAIAVLNRTLTMLAAQPTGNHPHTGPPH